MNPNSNLMSTTEVLSEPNQTAFHDELWLRLQTFELDLPGAGLTFTQRAAKENAWSLTYTKRAITEYKRFLFLARRANHVVCPSDAVDQVWHMHLTYTRSYWEELCGQVLQSPLHHGPTQGGSEEREKYYRLYERTLTSYRCWFGEDPPADIWPDAAQRFGEDLGCVRVNANRNWIIPKPRWQQAALGAASAGTLWPIAQLVANPLDWSGPNFLILYFGLLAIATLASWLAGKWLTRSEPTFQFQPGKTHEIGPIEAAWMQGGNQRAISCALVDLAQSNSIKLEGERILPSSNIAARGEEHRLKSLIRKCVADAQVGTTWKAVCRDANVGLVALRQSLEERGLVTTISQRTAAAAMLIALIGGVGLLGLAKIWVGWDRGKPVTFLVLGVLTAGMLLYKQLKGLPQLTSTGRQLRKKLFNLAQAHPEQLLSQSAPGDTTQADMTQTDSILLWSAAMLGTGVLASSPLADFHSFFGRSMAANQGASGGCGATGCGGDSGGGCGGGCGGCGGD